MKCVSNHRPILLLVALLTTLAALAPRMPEGMDRGDPGKTIRKWIDDLADPDVAVRRQAAEKLGRWSHWARDRGAVIQALARALDDDDVEVQENAVEAIAGLRPDRNVGLPLMRKALKSTHPKVRLEAIRGIAVFVPLADEDISVLTALLKDGLPEVRRAAARTLGELGEDGWAALSALVDTLGDQKDVQKSAVEAIVKLDPATETALPLLTRALEDTNANRRIGAVRLIGLLRPDQKVAVPLLFRAMSDPNQKVRYEAARRLGNFGSLTREHVLQLTEHLGDGRVGWKVCETLMGAGPNRTAAIPALAEALSSHEQVSWRASRALGMMGSDAKEAVPALRRRLAQGGFPAASAAEALGSIGPPAHEAVPDVIKLLEHGEPGVRARAAFALGDLAEFSTSAIPRLKDALDDPSEAIVAGACYGLYRIKGDVEPLIPYHYCPVV